MRSISIPSMLFRAAPSARTARKLLCGMNVFLESILRLSTPKEPIANRFESSPLCVHPSQKNLA